MSGRVRGAKRGRRARLRLPAVALLMMATAAGAQPPAGGPAPRPVPGAPPATPAARHESHETPRGWTFTLPKGDPSRGREVFVRMECHKCHEVAGESFSGATGGDRSGPELASMARDHPPEFFAESIVNPSAVIDEREWAGPDGSSKMPSYNDSMTVQELVDLVAYLEALTPPAGTGGGHHH